MVAEPQGEQDGAGEDLLPAPDLAHLQIRGLLFKATLDGGFINLVITDYPLPSGFDHATSDLLIRLPVPGWPDVKPDMWWFNPWLKVAATDRYAPATEHPQDVAGRRWQRWSRHFDANLWIAGTDGLASYLALVDRELRKAVA